MNPYSSSLNDAQWAVVEALLNDLLPKKKQTSPQKYSYRILFDAMLYQLKNGCHWADLSNDFFTLFKRLLALQTMESYGYHR